jgi:hypothetical protein
MWRVRNWSGSKITQTTAEMLQINTQFALMPVAVDTSGRIYDSIRIKPERLDSDDN